MAGKRKGNNVKVYKGVSEEGEASATEGGEEGRRDAVVGDVEGTLVVPEEVEG